MMALAATFVGAAAAWILGTIGLSVYPYELPYPNGEAIGVLVFLPNLDRASLVITGPGAPGVYYDPAGSPSNYVQR